MRMPEDTRKFRELILYISQKSAKHPKYGATKLNKVLYYSDFLAYATLGQSITGAEYMRLPQGPAPRRLKPLTAQMELERIIAKEIVQLPSGYTQHRTVNLRLPDLSVFSAAEIALVDDVILTLQDKPAEEVSELSHLELGWRVAADQETIPYSTAFLSDEPPTLYDVEKAHEVMAHCGSVASE